MAAKSKCFFILSFLLRANQDKGNHTVDFSNDADVGQKSKQTNVNMRFPL
jgi:hypothetical protein